MKRSIFFSLFFVSFFAYSAFLLRINDNQSDIVNLEVDAFTMSGTSDNYQKVHDLTLTTDSGLPIPITFYDRQSDTVLIAGQGLPGTKESMAVFAKLFNKYDVVLFDYRWAGKYELELIKGIVTCSPIRRILLNETEEVYAVLDFIHHRKPYQRIVGLGQCYSNFLFAKVQADDVRQKGTGPFTHLIFDSSWYSLSTLLENICSDPLLPLSPQTGGAPSLITMITNKNIVKKILNKLVFSIINDVTLEPYLAGVDIPVLFIHGMNDLFVPQAHFAKMWQAANPYNKAALLTPYQHSDNLYNKKVYRFIAESFIACDTAEDFKNHCREHNVI